MGLQGQDYTVTISVNPASSGTTTGAGTYASGTEVEVTATPITGYRFVNWTENNIEVSPDARYTFTIAADRALVANFSLLQYNITALPKPADGGMVTGAGEYSHGATVNLTATPNAGYVFLNWTDGVGVVYTEATWSFEATSDITVDANFVRRYTVTLESNPAEGGTTTGAGSYNAGSTATVTATPAAGYTFKEWKEGTATISTSNPYNFQVSSDISLKAEFEPDEYQINATSNPVNGGTVTGAGIYTHGTSVTVTATPSSGYQFVNWSEGGTAVSTSQSYTFNITANRTLVANFSLVSYSISTSSLPAGGGTTSGGGSYNYGESATVTATPSTGYRFVNWTAGGTSVSTNTSYTFAVTANRVLVANFTTLTYTITTATSPTGVGSTTGGGTYNYNASATVTAAPATGYSFVNWTEGGTVVSTASSYTFTVNSNRNLLANYSINTYTVSTSSSPSGGGTTSGGGSYNYGDAVTVTAAPASGYQFVNWTQGGTTVSTNSSYSFTVTGNRTLTANFSQITYTIALSSTPAAGGTTSGGGTYGSGTTATVTATPATGYRFVNWTQGGTTVSPNQVYSFSVTANITLVANFTIAEYTITTIVSPAEAGTASGGGSFNHGESVTVRATPSTGYQFTNWTENGSAVSTSANYTFTVSRSRNLMANFSQIPRLLTLTGPEGNSLRNNDIISLESPDAGSIVITVNANADWSITENSLWFNAVKEADSRIRINYLENISVMDKESPLKVTTTLNAELQVIVRQVARISQLSLSKFDDVVLYPNPAGDRTRLLFHQELHGKIRVSISSVQGIPLKTSEYEDLQANQIVELDLTGICPGQYLMIISYETDQKTFRMIKF